MAVCNFFAGLPFGNALLVHKAELTVLTGRVASHCFGFAAFAFTDFSSGAVAIGKTLKALTARRFAFSFGGSTVSVARTTRFVLTLLLLANFTRRTVAIGKTGHTCSAVGVTFARGQGAVVVCRTFTGDFAGFVYASTACSAVSVDFALPGAGVVVGAITERFVLTVFVAVAFFLGVVGALLLATDFTSAAVFVPYTLWAGARFAGTAGANLPRRTFGIQ